jgi:hypothetical protein
MNHRYKFKILNWRLAKAIITVKGKKKERGGTGTHMSLLQKTKSLMQRRKENLAIPFLAG